jgi:nucleoid DNA-binding protein
VNLGPYLHELLLEHENVIIPGFGAFISNYKPAGINVETNEIVPPSKEIIFNQKIRNNDGLLVGYVAEMQDVSHFDALRKIEKERENIIYLLDKGEQITLENIGVLFRNGQNEIEFEPQIQENLLLDSFGLEPVLLEEGEPGQETEIVTETTGGPVAEDEAVPVGISGESEIMNEEVSGDPEIEDNTGENIEEGFVGPIPGEEKSGEEKVEAPKPEGRSVEAKGNIRPEPVAAEKFAIGGQPEGKRKKRGWLWFLLIFIPLILAGLYLAKDEFSPDNSRGIVDTKKDSEPHGNVPVLDSAAHGSLQSLSTDTADQAVTENIPSGTVEPGTSNFYLVAGSFKEQENVDKFMGQFDAEGYEPFLLGKRGNFFIVALGAYPTEREAVIARDAFMKKNPGAGIWVFEDKAE